MFPLNKHIKTFGNLDTFCFGHRYCLFMYKGDRDKCLIELMKRFQKIVKIIYHNSKYQLIVFYEWVWCKKKEFSHEKDDNGCQKN